MRVTTTQGFQPNDVEGWYCYLEDERGHYIASIDIELGIITVSAYRSDFQVTVNVATIDEEDYIEDLRQQLFGAVDWEVDDSLLEQLYDLAARNE